MNPKALTNQRKGMLKMKKLKKLFKPASKKFRRLLSFLLAIATSMIIPVVSQADSHDGIMNIDGFRVNYGVTVFTHSTSSYLSCPGTSSMNPKPLFIDGSIRFQLLSDRGDIYISSFKQISVDYGERLYLTNSVSMPNAFSIVAGFTSFSFLGIDWITEYTA